MDREDRGVLGGQRGKGVLGGQRGKGGIRWTERKEGN